LTEPPTPPEPPLGDDFVEMLLKLTEPDPPAPEKTVRLISSTNIGSLRNYIN